MESIGKMGECRTDIFKAIMRATVWSSGMMVS